ncbi:MAG: hypothetical protein LBU57_08060 [Dysgonamonadaceae bacterium]|jgi:hypothetical protein|nr:hypothetical protein [Dysgonamonadaceae bacterium]
MENISLEVKKLACEIFALSIIVTERTEYDAWCHFSGHVNSMYLYVLKKEDKTDVRILDYSIDLEKEDNYVYQSDKPSYTISTIDYLENIQKALLQLIIPNTDEIVGDAIKILKQ